MKVWKTYWKLLWIPVLSLLIGLAGEWFYNAPFEKQGDYSYIPLEDIEASNFRLVNGNTFTSSGGAAALTVPFEKQYVDKFYYQFRYTTDELPFTCQLYVRTYASMDSPCESWEEILTDNNNVLQESSTTNIRRVADRITILLPDYSAPAEIYHIAINNTGNLSPYRLCFTSLCAFFALGVILLFLKRIPARLEYLFLIISLTLGTLSILAMAPHKVGFDEEIHFGRAYFLADCIKGNETLESPQGIHRLANVNRWNWPEDLPLSEQEHKAETAYWNYYGDYAHSNPDVEWCQEESFGFGLYSFCYIPQWLMLRLGMLLGLPFTMVYQMGRMGNLLLYCTLCFLAIRHITKGKRLLFILSLMPSPMMAAMTYSYDAWLNGFYFLGTAYLLEEWLGNRSTLSYRNYTIALAAFTLGSLAKPIYIPLVLIALLIPSSKFRSKKEQRILKGIVFVVCLLVMSTFFLPAVFNPVQLGGDLRGGDTSVARQMNYVFSHPFTYTKLLLASICKTFLPFLTGTQGLGYMGHYSNTFLEPLAVLLVSYTVLTDCRPEYVYRMKAWQKGAVLLLCFGVLCLIWTALYLSFTPVGLHEIRGVQGRYYLPVSLWILCTLSSGTIRSSVRQHTDCALLTLASLLLLLPPLYQNIICSTF